MKGHRVAVLMLVAFVVGVLVGISLHPGGEGMTTIRCRECGEVIGGEVWGYHQECIAHVQERMAEEAVQDGTQYEEPPEIGMP